MNHTTDIHSRTRHTRPRGKKMASDATESLEIEMKFEVPEDAVIPPHDAFASVGFTAGGHELHHMTAVYWDTPNRDLAKAGRAVRRRLGGSDDGWHVKERMPEGTKELQWPPSEDPPAELLNLLEAVVPDVRATLTPLATLHTTRSVLTLNTESGRAVIELADDSVHSIDHFSGVARAWREWEAELTEGSDPAHLSALIPVLEASGAVPSLSVAKIARASGQLVHLAIEQNLDVHELATVALIDVADQVAARGSEGEGQDLRGAALRKLARQLREKRV